MTRKQVVVLGGDVAGSTASIANEHESEGDVDVTGDEHFPRTARHGDVGLP